MINKNICKISPSMMCADIMNLGETVKCFEKNNIEYLHTDIMDGAFVPNFTLGTDYCRDLKKNTKIPLDIHLMIENPERILSAFPFDKGDIVTVHVESTRHLQKVLSEIRGRGARPFVALNPATPLCALDEVYSDIDGVLIMTVNPGFAGQKLIPSTLNKISALRRLLDEKELYDIEIEADGNVSFENAEKMRKAGVNIFVAGTSSVFRKDLSLENGIKMLREAIQ